MSQKNLRTLCGTLLLFFTFSLAAQSDLWGPQDRTQLDPTVERRIVPDKKKVYRIDTTALKTLLYAADHERHTRPQDSEYELTLPTPDGEWATFRFVAYDLLHPDLQEDWSYIRTWRGVSTNSLNTTIRIDWTARGFHAMIIDRQGGTWFVDPYYWNENTHYQVYYKKDYPAPTEPYTCHTVDDVKDDSRYTEGGGRAGDCELRSYRMALACTGEYADFHGGTVAGAASAMATTMGRVNGVYEMDLAMRFILVANNNNLIYLDPNTDPYTNSNGVTMLGQNQTNCDAVIGSANYDIGHVFSTGGGGVATLRSPCTNGKARGVTGQGAPVGDPFDIDYVAHEMGHQFGGNHTQNNVCQRSNASMEPGSASTIMGYAGICSPNVQSNSDAYYHGVNIQEIANYMETGGGNSCSTEVDVSNGEPTITAGQDYNIPGATPFVLTANANDPDGDPLTYCWEQYDNEVGEDMPPLPTNTQGPTFRSFFPTAAPERYFPRLTDLVNNVDPTWETLPATNRDMDFRVTVRDFDGTYGCTIEDDITLTVDASAGPFLVTNPNTNVSWFEASDATVTWDVAGTDSGPVDCDLVDIFLSYDGGLTYSTILISDTPNDGSQTITVPNGTSTTARVQVRCADNIFFDISDTNFTIEAATAPDYTFTYGGGNQENCEGSNGTLNFVVNTAGVGGYNDPLTLSVDSAPAGLTIGFSSNPVLPGEDVTVSISDFDNLNDGSYTVTIESTSSVGNRTVDLPFSLLPLANAPVLDSPVDGASDVSIFPLLDWDPVANVTGYSVEISDDPGFFNILQTVTPTTDEAQLTDALNGDTQYYWRVTGINSQCGAGQTSLENTFLTEPCYYYFNATEVEISEIGENAYTSEIVITNGGDITDLDVLNLDVTHSWTGDLRFDLVSPAGNISRTLVSDRCDGDDDILLNFDDAAASAISCPLNTGDDVQPEQSLAAFNNISLNGTWTLEFRDDANQDGGTLNNWGMKICTDNFSILPVEWLSFTALANRDQIDLTWVTTAEEDNAGFDLERRSEYDREFAPIAWIDAVDQSGATNTYAYTDREVQAGLTYYYRLRQQDYSGREDYSEIRSARIATDLPQWSFFPNPVAETLQLRFWNTEQAVTVNLYDAHGRIVRTQSITPNQATALDLNGLPGGVYWLRVGTNTWEVTERVVKI